MLIFRGEAEGKPHGDLSRMPAPGWAGADAKGGQLDLLLLVPHASNNRLKGKRKRSRGS